MTDTIYFSAGRKYNQEIQKGSTWANQIIKMNNVVNKNGIEYDTDTGIITLEKGQTYRVTSQLGIGGNGDKPYFYAFGLFNLNTEVQIGPLAEALQPGLNTRNASGGFLDVIHTAAESGKYCIRMASNVKADSSSHIRQEGTFLNIVQIMPGTDVLSLRRLTNQTIPYGKTWAGQNIIMTPVNYDRRTARIEYNRDTGEFTLMYHQTYRITAQLGWQASAPEFYAFGLFDAYTNEQIGPTAEALPPNMVTPNASGGVLDVIYTPFSIRSFCLRMVSGVTAGFPSSIRADVSTFLNIVSIPEEKSYMSARRFVDQPFLFPEDYTFGTGVRMHIAEKRGTIGYSPDYGEIKLKGGRTYRITAQVGIGAKLPGYYKFIVGGTDEKFLPYSATVSPNFPFGRPVSSGVYDIILSPWRDISCYCRVEPGGVGYQSVIIRASTSTFLNVVEL